MNIRETFREVREKLSELEKAHPEGCVFITSETNSSRNSVGGQTMQVTLHEAAKQLVHRTAHLSSEAEIAAFKEAGLRSSTQAAKTELNRNPVAAANQNLVEAIAKLVPAAPAQTGPVQPPVKK